MRRSVLLAAAALALALSACSQPSNQQAEAPPAETPIVRACNAIEPDMSRAFVLPEEPVAAASLPPELPGGPITPGIYDLVSGARLDGAPAWPDARAISVEVTEGPGGVTFNWAQAGATGEAERWTATFHQGPPVQLAYTCGRTGESEIAFAASAENLELRVPDPSGAGAQRLVFARRA